MPRGGKKTEQLAMETSPPTETRDSMAILLQVMQQEICEERHATEERFNLLVQAMNQSGQPHTTYQPSTTVPPPTYRIPASINRLSGTPNMVEFTVWRKSWNDFAMINRIELHDQPTQLAALRTHLSQDFQAIFDKLSTIAASVPDQPTVDEALLAIQSFIRGMQNIIVDRFHFFTRH